MNEQLVLEIAQAMTERDLMQKVVTYAEEDGVPDGYAQDLVDRCEAISTGFTLQTLITMHAATVQYVEDLKGKLCKQCVEHAQPCRREGPTDTGGSAEGNLET